MCQKLLKSDIFVGIVMKDEVTYFYLFSKISDVANVLAVQVI